MKKGIVVIVLVLITSAVFSQILVPKDEYVPEIRKARNSFAISLIAGGHTSLVSFGIVRELPDNTKEHIFLRKDTFMRQFGGGETSKANPEKIDYFEEFDIPRSVIDELWKLKHDIHPYSEREVKGWAKGPIPSAAQFEMLKPFGISKISDYCYGDNLIKLLLKVSDPLWVGEYQHK